MNYQIKVGDVIHFRELTEKEEESDAWGDDWFFAGRAFEVKEFTGDFYALYCEDLPIPCGRFHKSFFDYWDVDDFSIVKFQKEVPLYKGE